MKEDALDDAVGCGFCFGAVLFLVFGIMFVRGCNKGVQAKREMDNESAHLFSFLTVPITEAAVDGYRQSLYFPSRLGFDFGMEFGDRRVCHLLDWFVSY